MNAEASSQPVPISRTRTILKRCALIVGVLFIAVLVAFLVYFPGRQNVLALTLATGLGVDGLQQRVDELEEKAIAGAEFTDDEKAFLRDLYTCFAKGGKLTIVLRQSGQLMDRYLACSGEPLHLEPRIFLGSRQVREQIALLRGKLETDLYALGRSAESYCSEDFYMADPAFLESFVGLYWGQISLRAERMDGQRLVLRWRADMPWQWPSYASLHAKYGDYHAQSFPLPNARSILQESRYALRVDDGLGEYLSQLGLAKPFAVWAEWEETVEMGSGWTATSAKERDP